jgi:hypothetical protein
MRYHPTRAGLAPAGTRQLRLAHWNAGTPLRLVEPLPVAQHRVRPQARPLCGAHLDRDDFHHLMTAYRPSPSAARDLIAYSFLTEHQPT